MTFLSISGLCCLFTVEVTQLWIGFYFWISFAITIAFSINLSVLLYGIFTNTTPNEMFNSHKHIHLWPKVEYYPNKNIVMRAYLNKNRKDWKSNLGYYLSYRAEWCLIKLYIGMMISFVHRWFNPSCTPSTIFFLPFFASSSNLSSMASSCSERKGLTALL